MGAIPERSLSTSQLVGSKFRALETLPGPLELLSLKYKIMAQNLKLKKADVLHTFVVQVPVPDVGGLLAFLLVPGTELGLDLAAGVQVRGQALRTEGNPESFSCSLYIYLDLQNIPKQWTHTLHFGILGKYFLALWRCLRYWVESLFGHV